jgi:tripartite-type tricarboxylate transporter receptor subunit TctC
MKLSRRRVLAVIASGAALPGVRAQAPDFPTRAVRIVVPFVAGSSPDVVMRIVTPRLSELWKQPVLIDNKPGAAGAIGTQIVAGAPPDGHTLLYVINSVMCANPHMYTRLRYDPFKDFEAVSQVISIGYVLLARQGFPAANLAQAIALIRQNPGKFTYSSNGPGSGNHVVAEMLSSAAGLKMIHVPTTGDTGAPVVSGHVDLVMSPYTNGVNLAKSGRVQPLGVTLGQRARLLPDTPSLSEAVPGVVADAWHGVFAPAGTPAALVARISRDIAQVLNEPDTRRRLNENSLEVVGSSPAEFSATLRRDFDKWGRVIREANIKLD